MSYSSPSVAATLAQLPDPRSPKGRRYPWTGLLLLVTLGLLSGANTQRALARFAQNLRRPWLRRLGLRRPPSQPTLHRLLRRLDVDQLQAALSAWLREAQAPRGQAPDPPAPDPLDSIAVDGKTLRGARRSGAPDVHLLSACATRRGLVIDQLAVPDTTTELGVVDRLLGRLALGGRTVTFDALFTQWAVAETVGRAGGAYLMPVKENQHALRHDIAWALARRERCTDSAERVRSSHGRVERRTLWVAPAGAARGGVLGWPYARQLLELSRRVVVKRTGQVREETVYAVTSLTREQADAGALLWLWQQHWRIENGVHWVRDVVFGEDRATTRTGHAPQAFATFRNLALSCIRLWRGPAITASREYYATHPSVLFRQLGIQRPRL